MTFYNTKLLAVSFNIVSATVTSLPHCNENNPDTTYVWDSDLFGVTEMYVPFFG